MTLGLSWDNLELRTYPRDKYDDKCEVRDYPGMILNEKNDFTFWIRYGISTNFGMIVLDYPKSEVTHCIWPVCLTIIVIVIWQKHCKNKVMTFKQAARE